jgi:hypothetical protein
MEHGATTDSKPGFLRVEKKNDRAKIEISQSIFFEIEI